MEVCRAKFNDDDGKQTETGEAFNKPDRSEAKMIIMSWYRMWFEIFPVEKGTMAKLSISYLPPKQWFYKILSFFFTKWYCNWCLTNMLNDTKKHLEKVLTD